MNTLLRADIIHKAGILRKAQPCLRKGQSIFRVAYDINKTRLDRIIVLQPEYDCFYDDSKVDAFLDEFCKEEN